MRFPKFIRSGDTIGFVAPAFGCATEPYHSAFLHSLEKFHSMGFATNLGTNCFVDEGIGISNKPELCAEELMNMYQSRNSDCLISCGGGELMCEVMSYLDFSALAASKAKWFMGYSDNTNFSFLLTTLADTASIYGPCAAAFGMEPWHEAILDAMELLKGKKLTMNNYSHWEKESMKDETHPLEPYNVTEPFALRSFPEEEKISFEGRLLGGCLDCLVHLAGTRFDKVTAFAEKYKGDGIVWFLESCDLNVMEIRRCLWNLKEAGWFRYVKGFLIRRPMHFHEPMMGLDQYEAVTGILGDLGVPIIMDLDIGHLAPMMPIICGSYGTVKVNQGEFQITMEVK